MTVATARSITDYRRRAFVRLIAESAIAGEDPLDSWSSEHPLWEVFEDRADLLRALQEHWVDLLSHRVYGAPEYPLGNDTMRDVYTALAEAHPTLRAILAKFEDDVAIADQLMEEHVLLARAAGNLDTRASASTLVWRARDLLATVPEQRASTHVAAS
ncbi:MAG TPA: hypothetical protein VLI04_07695 [Nocardioidaceae bacterium]|nr:hypothetical protein [Nocardioidaceae bacterium]